METRKQKSPLLSCLRGEKSRVFFNTINQQFATKKQEGKNKRKKTTEKKQQKKNQEKQQKKNQEKNREKRIGKKE